MRDAVTRKAWKSATGLPYGSYAKIARRLGVSLNAVRSVDLGISTSKQVARELRRLRSRLAAKERRQQQRQQELKSA